MRIIKLSTKEFDDVDEVIAFFEKDLLSQNPPGKFRFPPGWIARDGLDADEPILFSYQGRMLYSAKAASGRRDNHDEYSDQYPSYFEINMDTVRRVDYDLHDFEKQLHRAGITKSIVQSQGWPTISDTELTDDLWQSLRGE